MPSISNKIELLRKAEGLSRNAWAEKYELKKSSVHDWVKKGMMPSSANFKLLIKNTGIPEEWWLDEQHKSKPELQVNQEIVQYEKLKVYQDNVVKLNAKPKIWLEEIINYFVSLPEEEQQKINTYSKDLYEKVKNYDQRKKVNITISGLVEVPMPEDEDGNNNESKGNVQ